MNTTLPRWVDIGLIPLINLALALFVAGLVVIFIGEDPIRAVQILIRGALGSDYGIGFTLYYATNFIFTGLAVAIAFHASLFNIGGEGQASIAGIGVALAALTLDQTHWLISLPAAIVMGGLFGAAWAAIPAYLQAKRGSHIVITTIMFNFIASALLVYLLVNVMKVEGSMATETRKFQEGAQIPFVHEMAGWFGLKMARTPMNISFFLALICCVFTYLLIWRSRLGYEIRAFGFSEPAAVYAGINPVKITMIAMLLSGAMAGLMAINTVMGDQQRLVLDAVQGAGFVGIAVALMGRSHPVGVLLAAILFGILYQGGAELAFEMPKISRDMIVVIQALVILFTGALENMVRIPVARAWLKLDRRSA
ncbi:ABC transporter permease [Oceanomicrobium pacificus]|uniref:ABC transporter permease n=1 Tax=Oceanomicrobium pacificus TaxID=2692916 RepID=A0A6B0TPE2_9RHOB|nr:ABC transporter permease [Oceanomicrobium pacificus]MXU64489.1 ABC transporter permease [Oceanomicrobium pacificus]